jgi:hypothetical protein
MKSLAALFIASLMCLSAAHADVPSIIASGFDAYKASGSKGALAIWLRGSSLASTTGSVLGLPLDIGPGNETADAWGPMESYEILAVYSPTTRLRRIYAVAYFPQGPLFCSFDLYKASGSWTTYGLRFSVRPDEFMPVELIEKTG